MKKILLLLTFSLVFLFAKSQIILTFIGSEGTPLDSVTIVNLNKNCDTTLHGIQVWLYLQAMSVGVNENKVVSDNSFLVKVHNMQGQLVSQGRFDEVDIPDNQISLLTFFDGTSYVTKKVFGRINRDTRLELYKSSSYLTGWTWDYGDYLQYTGYATGYFPITIYDTPLENQLYVFDFQPSIVGVVRGNVYYEGTTMPISGVNVSVAGNYDVTDSLGYYYITSQVGYHAIYATKLGYDDYGGVVEVTTEDTVNLDICMTSDIYTFDINGLVINTLTGYPLGNTVINVLNPDCSVAFTDTTDQSGYYELVGIPLGSREIRAIYCFTNCLLIDTIVNVNTDMTINFEFQLGGVCDSDSILYAGQWYHTVQIGSQCWLKENLNVGDYIQSGDFASTDNGIVEKFCYDDDESNCAVYGGLYQWSEMMQYDSTNSQGICPDGWRVPSDGDWVMLESYVDPDWTGDWFSTGARGIVAGLVLKDTTGNGTDDYGMSLLLSGAYRSFTNGDWYETGVWGDYWSSNTSEEAWWKSIIRYVGHMSDQVNRDDFSNDKQDAKAVRCIKN